MYVILKMYVNMLPSANIDVLQSPAKKSTYEAHQIEL